MSHWENISSFLAYLYIENSRKEETMKSVGITATKWIGLICLLVVEGLWAQEAAPETRELEQKFLESRKASDELQRNYIWNSRTDITREGKVMEMLIEENIMGPDGRIIRKIINDQEAKLPSSFLIHQIAEDEKEKIIAFMKGLHAYLLEYSLPQQDKVSKFFSEAPPPVADVNGLILVSGENVVSKGDKLDWWIDHKTWSISKASIVTTFEGDQIEFNAAYNLLPCGLNYLAFAEIIIPAKKITILIHCYDYTNKG